MNWLPMVFLIMLISTLTMIDLGDVFFVSGGLCLIWGVSLLMDDIE